MANEITKQTKLSWTKSGASIIVSTSETVDQTGEQAIENVQIIGGTSEALVFGDVTAPAHICFKNINKTWSQLTSGQQAGYTDKADYEAKNRVFVGTTNPTTSADAIYTLYPGSGVTFLQSITLAWFACKATDSVNLLVTAIEA